LLDQLYCLFAFHMKLSLKSSRALQCRKQALGAGSRR